MKDLIKDIKMVIASSSEEKIKDKTIEKLIIDFINEKKAFSLCGVGCSKLNEWIKIDPTKANTIPEKPVWIITIDSKEIEYKEADEFIELNYASHYRLIDKPEPPL